MQFSRLAYKTLILYLRDTLSTGFYVIKKLTSRLYLLSFSSHLFNIKQYLPTLNLSSVGVSALDQASFWQLLVFQLASAFLIYSADPDLEKALSHFASA